MRVLVLPGVLRPPSDCRLLARVMHERELANGARTLDVFTGSGALAVAAALAGAGAVTAVDLQRRAVWNTRLNAWLNRVRVRALRGDLFEPVRGERFDLILANPPYLPGETNTLPARGRELAWEGGSDGRAVLDRFCDGAAGHLSPEGSVLLVQSSLSDEQKTLERLAESGLDPEIAARERGPLGPIAASRADLFEQRGLLPPGVRDEELIVIAGRR